MNNISCENCVNCRIYEDRSEDMRWPYALCKKDHDIVTIGVVKFKPVSGECIDFIDGEAEYI